MSATIRIIVSVFFASSLVFVAAPTGAQETRTLTVAPETGLLDGDVVTLEGAGFTSSGGVGYCQGVFDETPDPTDCDSWPSLGRIGMSGVNTAGEFSAQYFVHRFISVSGIGTVDCAQPSANCAISASNVSGTNVVGPPVVTPISFAPQPALSLTVTPATGLQDGDVVVVEGTGFLPDQTVRLCQEPNDQVSVLVDCSTEAVFLLADDGGAFSAEYAVQRFVTAFGTADTTDCAAASATCAISAWDLGPLNLSVVATIGFAPQPPVTVAVFGTVTGPTGAPLVGAAVWAYKESDSWVGSLQTVTDAQGSYEFEELELFTPYRILFRHPAGSTLVSEWFNNQQTRRSATVVSFLSAGQFVQANAQLSEQGRISGSVTDTEGNPVAGVAVWAFGSGDTWVGSYVGPTQADGSYLLGNVRSDSFLVRFVPPTGSGLAIEWWDDAVTRKTADAFPVDETTVTGIDAVLEPTP